MQKLMLAVLIAAMVHIPTAEASYIGSLNSDFPYTLEVTTTSRVAVTILFVVKGRLDVEEILVFDSTSPALTRTIPPRVDRIIFMADASPNGNGVVKISQGTTTRFEVPVNPHDAIVVDPCKGDPCS